MPTRSTEPRTRAGEERPFSFDDWTKHVLSAIDLSPARHHHLLCAELTKVSEGASDRLMLLMPPGSAKSTYASVLFPAWWFTKYPNSNIIAACHTTDLAQFFGRRVRSLVIDHSDILRYNIAPGARAATQWQTDGRGLYFATGLRGPLTGRRADLVIIDDPVKSHAEADSAVFRDHVWNWYRADLTTRLKPGGKIVLIMTRWHEDDLGGRLLAHNPEEWRVLRLPALAEDNDPIGRPPGDPLWPEWEDHAALARKRATVGDRVWSALYQQSPRPPGGSFFRVGQIEVLGEEPSGVEPCVRAWDLAATSHGGSRAPDRTVGVKLRRGGSGRMVVVDVVKIAGEAATVLETIARTASIDGRNVAIGLPIDPGAGGKIAVSSIARLLEGYRIVSTREVGSKTSRATPVAAQVEAGNLAIVRAPWNHQFLDELSGFPNAENDDQVDALSRAFAMLIEAGAPARRLQVPLLAR